MTLNLRIDRKMVSIVKIVSMVMVTAKAHSLCSWLPLRAK